MAGATIAVPLVGLVPEKAASPEAVQLVALVAFQLSVLASPAVMKQMAQQIPNARYTEMAGVGHLMNLEAPDEFDRILLDFLRESAPRARPDLH